MSKILIITATILISLSSAFELQGINLVSVPFTRARYSDPQVINSLKHVKTTGANFISIPVTLFQDTLDSTDIGPINKEVVTSTKINDTPTDAEITSVVKQAASEGLRSMIVLHVEINQPGWINSAGIGREYSPYLARKWFEQYIVHVKHYAELAQEAGADIFCIGHNLYHLSQFEVHFNELIAAAREEFKGQLTYSTSVKNNEFRDIGFWGNLDLIGLIGDLDIEVDQDTQVEHLDEHLQGFIGVAKYLEKTWKKLTFVSLVIADPIFEVQNGNHVSKIHHKAQANFLEGFLNGLKTHDALKGVFIGSWVPHPAFGGAEDASISPQFKESEKVIRAHFGGETTLPEQPKEVDVQHNIFCEACQVIDL